MRRWAPTTAELTRTPIGCCTRSWPLPLLTGLIPANPCPIPRAMKSPRRREPTVLTVAEVGHLAEKIEPKRFRALILIAAWCGLRWGELIELRRKDIGDGCETISVSRGVTHRSGCRIDSPRSGRGRMVLVPPHIRADIKHHLDTFVVKEPDAQLFPPVRGGCHLNDKVFTEHFNTSLAGIGREGVRIHDLRHFAGTQAARVGNLTEIMERLGHSTVSASLALSAQGQRPGRRCRRGTFTTGTEGHSSYALTRVDSLP